MRDNDKILAAYHHAAARHRERTGVSYPAIRAGCVRNDGTITAADTRRSVIVATWLIDNHQRAYVRLV